MKIDAITSGAVERRTRDLVARLLLERGPATAAALARQLGLSPAGVRRHLDAMLAEQRVSYREVSVRRRGRGRPARLFSLTETGRQGCAPHAYDDLAAAAMRYLGETAGDTAITEFAERRVGALEERHRDAVTASGSPADRVETLASALTEEGYAATAHTLSTGGQLCQHHCPVAHVAAEFPQLCEAETRAFERMLGTHVQRLATIARGDEVCTTHVPAAGSVPAETAETAGNAGISGGPGGQDGPDSPDGQGSPDSQGSSGGAGGTAAGNADPTRTTTTPRPGRKS